MKILSYIKALFLSHQYRILAFMVAAVVLATMYHLIKDSGALEERAAIATVQVAATKKGVTDGNSIDQKNISLSDDDLDRRLARWMLD